MAGAEFSCAGLTVKRDRYSGLVCAFDDAYTGSVDEFNAALTESLALWTAGGIRGVWCVACSFRAQRLPQRLFLPQDQDSTCAIRFYSSSSRGVHALLCVKSCCVECAVAAVSLLQLGFKIHHGKGDYFMFTKW